MRQNLFRTNADGVNGAINDYVWLLLWLVEKKSVFMPFYMVNFRMSYLLSEVYEYYNMWCDDREKANNLKWPIKNRKRPLLSIKGENFF